MTTFFFPLKLLSRTFSVPRCPGNSKSGAAAPTLSTGVLEATDFRPLVTTDIQTSSVYVQDPMAGPFVDSSPRGSCSHTLVPPWTCTAAFLTPRGLAAILPCSTVVPRPSRHPVDGASRSRRMGLELDWLEREERYRRRVLRMLVIALLIVG